MLRNAAASKKALLSEEACSFIKKLDPNRISRGEIVVREPYVYLVPKGLPNLKGLRILRQGLLIGEMKKLRFEPSQALASALHGKEYGKIISLKRDDPNVIRYLKCESIEFEEQYEDGWYLICVEDYPLGWGKITKNQFKNKYLPGWRWV
jgi:NOL1/NOP2/fmu family ribosome biogenesis protein